jgi:hypothetical protein
MELIMQWYQKNKTRFLLEKKLIRRHYPTARIFTDNKKIVILMKISLKRLYLIEMIYPKNFPYSQPKVFVKKPSVFTSDQYKDGSLCLFDPNQAGPQISGKMLLDWTIKFLKDYEAGKLK